MTVKKNYKTVGSGQKKKKRLLAIIGVIPQLISINFNFIDSNNIQSSINGLFNQLISLIPMISHHVSVDTSISEFYWFPWYELGCWELSGKPCGSSGSAELCAAGAGWSATLDIIEHREWRMSLTPRNPNYFCPMEIQLIRPVENLVPSITSSALEVWTRCVPIQEFISVLPDFLMPVLHILWVSFHVSITYKWYM